MDKLSLLRSDFNHKKLSAFSKYISFDLFIGFIVSSLGIESVVICFLKTFILSFYASFSRFFQIVQTNFQKGIIRLIIYKGI